MSDSRWRALMGCHLEEHNHHVVEVDRWGNVLAHVVPTYGCRATPLADASVAWAGIRAIDRLGYNTMVCYALGSYAISVTQRAGGVRVMQQHGDDLLALLVEAAVAALDDAGVEDTWAG